MKCMDILLIIIPLFTTMIGCTSVAIEYCNEMNKRKDMGGGA